MEQFEQDTKQPLPELSKNNEQELPFENLQSINDDCFHYNITNNTLNNIQVINQGKNSDLDKLEKSKEESRQAHEIQLELLRLKEQAEQNKSNQEFLWELEKFRKENDANLKRYEKEIDKKIAQQQLDFQHLKLEEEKKLQQKQAKYDRDTQLLVAQKEIEATLSMPEIQKSLDYWPLTICPSQILQSLLQKDKKNIPLYIVFSPPKIEYDRFGCKVDNFPDLGNRLEQGIREFLEKNYPDHDQKRPTKFLGGAWDSKRSRAESSIEHLFSKLQSIPMLVLESEIDVNYVNIRMGYWEGIQRKGKQYEPIKKTIFSEVDYIEIIYKSVRERTKKWEKERKKLIEQGETNTSLNLKNPTLEKNLAVLQKEREGYSEIEQEYTISKEDINALNNYLNINHCLIIGYIIDSFYLRHYKIPPLLPKLLSQVIKPPFSKEKISNKLINFLIKGYRDIYQELIKENPAWEPEFHLELAKTILVLNDSRSWIEEEIKLSLSAFLKKRNKQVPYVLLERLKAVELSINMDNEKYLETLNYCLKNIDFNYLLDITEALYKQGIKMIQEGNHKKAVVLFTQVIERDSINPFMYTCCNFAYFKRAYSYIKLKEYKLVLNDFNEENISKSFLIDLSNKNQQFCLFLANKTQLPNEEPFKTLALDGDQNIRQAVASNINISSEILKELLQDTSWLVRYEVIKNYLNRFKKTVKKSWKWKSKIGESNE